MKLNELGEVARKAIRSNFAVRNARVFTDETRHCWIRSTRRHQIREWVSVLRVARDSDMAECVAKALKESGPLMAHDLRRRVIIAGLEHRQNRGPTSV